MIMMKIKKQKAQKKCKLNLYSFRENHKEVIITNKISVKI